MAIKVVDLTEADIPGAIEVIQQAFADDPYFKWVFDSSQVSGASVRSTPYILKSKPKSNTGTKLTNVLARSSGPLRRHPVQQAKKL